MDPDPLCGYDVIVKTERGWNGQRELQEDSARESLDALKRISGARAWWLVDVKKNKVLIAGGEGIGHHPKEYGYDPSQGLVSVFYKR